VRHDLLPFASIANQPYHAKRSYALVICYSDTLALRGAAMTEVRKFDEALVRFERAIAKVEQATAQRRDTVSRLELLEKQASSLVAERQQMDTDMNRVKAKAAELVDTSKKAAGKIDSAVSRIRAVLYSNSGGA
jgi:septal ring factor EnvC (AmiA/AmiB activator)